MMRNRPLAPPQERQRADFGLAQVNIVLLLVLFFLVTGTIVETEEQAVPLPETEDLPLDRLPRPLLLITEAGAWTLDGMPVEATSLAARLIALSEDTGATEPVHLLLPRTAPAELALAALRAIEGTGRQMRLVTLTGAGARSP